MNEKTYHVIADADADGNDDADDNE